MDYFYFSPNQAPNHGLVANYRACGFLAHTLQLAWLLKPALPFGQCFLQSERDAVAILRTTARYLKKNPGHWCVVRLSAPFTEALRRSHHANPANISCFDDSTMFL